LRIGNAAATISYQSVTHIECDYADENPEGQKAEEAPMFQDLVNSVAARVLFIIFILALGFIIERLIPADKIFDGPGVILNWMVGIPFMILGEIAASVLVASLFVKYPWSRTSSFLVVPDRGSFFRALGLLYTWIAMRDFFYYWLHRAQHKWNWLWVEHALHHSDEHVNITTSYRHHWLEVPLNVIFVVAPISYLLHPPLITVSAVTIALGATGLFIHLNARIGLGRFGWLIATPQQHRIHHSLLPEHMDKNFAQFCPLWDVVFGTYYKARRDEYPPTGLASGEQVKTLRTSLLMPFIAWRKMLWPG
jgi:sterol desaturase/sphingolipid hydroxylase (fatty acid hydroxylase superfamily)